MYCHNCGREQPDQYKFCANCGTELKSVSQPQPPRNNDEPEKPGAGKILGEIFVISLVSVFVVFGLLIALVAFSGDSDEEIIPTETDAIQTNNQGNSSGEELPRTDTLIPDNGWYTEDGKRYYFQDGAMYVDVQEIDGEYYYFREDGTLAVNSDVDYDGWILKTDHDGIITRVVFDKIGGEWSEEDYHFGYSGSSSILELAVPIEDCTSMSFYLEANGKRGAKVNGKWKIYVRNNGKWNFLQEINYTEPSGSFDFEFDEPVSFDAITAYPTVQGNASYTSFFYPQNVDCPFRVLQNLL